MTPEILFKNLNSFKNSDISSLKEALKTAIRCSFAEKFAQGDERPCENNDFSESKKYNEANILFLWSIFEDLVETGYLCGEKIAVCMDKNLLALILIICGENVDLKPWNTEKTVESCKLILCIILKLFNCCDVSSLICRNREKKLTNEILYSLRPKLLPNTWKNYPASVIAYKWILEMIVMPDLSYYLPSVLPTALLLVDDYVNENRIIGIKCLNHIVNNLTLAELQFHGHGDVIYSALLPLIRTRDVEILNEVMPCLIVLTTKLEVDIGRKKLNKWSKFDNVYEIVLENMELESLIDLRNCYIKNLLLLLNASDCPVLRWSKRLFRIFKEYLETAGQHSDDKTTNYCLKGIKKYIEITKPASTLFSKTLLFILFIGLYNATTADTDIQRENKKIAVEAIKLLDVFTESIREGISTSFQNSTFKNKNFYNSIMELFNLK